MTNTTPPMEGQLIASQFKILRKLGQGGMGTVYLAEQVDIDRKVVVKVLNPELSALNPIALERFRREAKAVAQLNHPNIVQIFVFGTAENGQMYLAMEYIEGRDLAHDLKRGQLPQPKCLRILDQVCSALIEAHGAGIVHRDLKPENIMLADRHGNPDYVKVLDFGIAKLHDGGSGPSLTQAGTVFGTPRYMSPEQVKGENVDARADIYALGVILYEMLTGSHPFEATTSIDYLMKHVSEPVVPPSEAFDGLEIQPRIESIVMKALEKDPAARYQSVAEMQRDVRIALRDFSESARGYPSHEMQPPAARAGRTGRATTAASTAPVTREGRDRDERGARRGTPAWVWVVVALVLVGGVVGAAVALAGSKRGDGPLAGNDPTTHASDPTKGGGHETDPTKGGGHEADPTKGGHETDPTKGTTEPGTDDPPPTTEVAEGEPVDGFPIPKDMRVYAESPQANTYVTNLSARDLVGFFKAKLHGKFNVKPIPNGLQVDDEKAPFTYITMMPNADGIMITLSRNAFFERKEPPKTKPEDAFGIEFPDGVSLMIKTDSAYVMTSRRPFAEICEYFAEKYGKGDGVFVAKDTAAATPYCTIANNGSAVKWQAISIVANPNEKGSVMISIARKN